MDRTDEADPAAKPTGPEPGEPRRRLDRAPGERYLDEERAAATRAAAAGEGRSWATSPLLRSVGVGVGGAVAMTLLGGPISLTAGLVVVAAFVGWLVGSVARPGRAVAVVVAVGAVVAGLVGIWLYSRLEGGALAPLDYLLQVQGVLVPVELLAAGLAAAAASR